MNAITERLIARINRRLAGDGRQLHKSHNARCRLEFGAFYIRDFEVNNIVDTYVDVERLGRELGALRPHETLQQAEAA